MLISASTTHVVKIKLLRQYLVAVKETWNREDMNASEPGFILAYLTWIYVNPTRLRNDVLHKECKTTLVHDVIMTIFTFWRYFWRLDVIVMLVSAKRFDVNM